MDTFDRVSAYVLRDMEGAGPLYGIGLLAKRDSRESASGAFLFTASTATSDRARDVVLQDWVLGPFRDNPVMLDSHQPDRVVGHASDVEVVNGKLELRAVFDHDSPDPTIAAVAHSHAKGHRRAVSVGFRPGTRTPRSRLPKSSPHYAEPVEVDTPWGKDKIDGWLFGQCELLEVSSVAVPMNAEALQHRNAHRAAPPDLSLEALLDAPDPGRFLGRSTAPVDDVEALLDRIEAPLRDRFRKHREWHHLLAGIAAVRRSPVEPEPEPDGEAFLLQVGEALARSTTPPRRLS